MTDVFWNVSTPVAGAAAYGQAYLPVRIQGTAADGSLDTFAQIPISQVVSAIFSGLPDEANGDAIPAAGSGLPYKSAEGLKFA